MPLYHRLLVPAASLLAATIIFRPGTAPAAPPTEGMTTERLVSQLRVAIDNLKTLRCTVHAQERLGGKYTQANSTMKLGYAPLQIFLRNKKGVEVLWVTGQNDGDAWVYPNSFPYVTLSLDPNGMLMRRGQHHSVLDAGYGMIADILRGSAQRPDKSYERSFRYTGDTTIAGRPCYQLSSDFPKFRYVSYTAGKGETVAQVADKFGCGEYRIMEKNGVAADAPIPTGKVLQVPNSYGTSTLICVDKKLYLPLLIRAEDDKGLFEEFKFLDVEANQPIPAQEFTKEFKDYNL
ncbi:DUF1571 domain-containing protein [Hymenobacter sp. BT188]|uniref:LysM peptidoglycan-binding domain-containing protein n=1 Tax=Hymenobacter sp. BT188 TaxID=2763504 RepID=UPI0016515A12|nr:DUF1571 domain-containing protein [Hymenobacter sp. BT188]MBC6608970.1 DUF1571 domain-containing protein [Hymenobacter sp. BT188]